MPNISKRRRLLEAARGRKTQLCLERETAACAPPEVLEEELEDEEEAAITGAEVHWDEASTDGSEEELETTEDEDNAESDGNPGPHYATAGDAAQPIDKLEMHLSD